MLHIKTQRLKLKQALCFTPHCPIYVTWLEALKTQTQSDMINSIWCLRLGYIGKVASSQTNTPICTTQGTQKGKRLEIKYSFSTF